MFWTFQKQFLQLLLLFGTPPLGTRESDPTTHGKASKQKCKSCKSCKNVLGMPKALYLYGFRRYELENHYISLSFSYVIKL